jgi:hypothetical protein
MYFCQRVAAGGFISLLRCLANRFDRTRPYLSGHHMGRLPIRLPPTCDSGQAGPNQAPEIHNYTYRQIHLIFNSRILTEVF